MDPDVCLQELRELAHSVMHYDGEVAQDALDLAARVQALDEWLRKGGSPPAVWCPSRARMPE